MTDETTRIALNEMLEKIDTLEKRVEEQGARADLAREIDIFPDEEEDGGGGGGGAQQQDSGMFAWDADRRQIGPGGVMIGRRWSHIDRSAEGMQDGAYYVEVTLGEVSDTAQVVRNPSSINPTETKCRIPIYTISDGEVENDLRGAFVVPCWE